MPARAIGSGMISFGLVAIPVKLYTAASPHKLSFHLLDKQTGSRLKQQYVSAQTGEVVDRDRIGKGYEYARGQFVQLSEEELKALDGHKSGAIDIAEFVPAESVDPVQVEKSYYLGPDRGGDKAYQLLAKAMGRKGQVAVARWGARGKDQLVLVRPYRGGLLLHQMFYGDEVRAFDDIDVGPELTFADVEIDLAEKLIDQLARPTLDASKFRDAYTDRVKAMVDEKIAGHEVTVAPEAPPAKVIDLFEALKRSLAERPAQAPAEAQIEPKPVKKAAPRKAAAKKVAG